jgi:hypothetical protein
MGAIKFYIKTFDQAGNYEADFVDITKDVNVSSIGSINQSIDSNDYDIGFFKYSSFSLALRNDHGKYSNPPATLSMFKYKRKSSIFKMTWEIQDIDTQCCVAICGEYKLSPAVEIFTGLIDDDASTTDIYDQRFKFTVLGFESLFSSVEVNFGSLANGQTTKAILLLILDQVGINDLLVVDTLNINPNVDSIIDVVEPFRNVTVKKALDDLLFLSNSVLFIKDQTIYISSRVETASIDYTFYGQASINGVENIISLSDVRIGLNKTFNLLKWEETDLSSRDFSSIQKWGIRSRDPINFDQITNNSRRQDILDSLVTEYKNPKMELEIQSPFTYELLLVGILNKVVCDYPTVFVGAQGGDVPVYGASKYGVAKYPLGQWSLTLDPTTEFKIMSLSLNIKQQTVTLKLREV